MYIFFDLNLTEMQTLIKIRNVAFEKMCGFKNTLIIRNVHDVSYIMFHLGFHKKVEPLQIIQKCNCTRLW